MKIFRTFAMLTAIFLLTACAGPNNSFEVTNAWSRPAVQNQIGVIYFEINNASSETEILLEAQSEIAEHVEIHESRLMGAADQAESESHDHEDGSQHEENGASDHSPDDDSDESEAPDLGLNQDVMQMHPVDQVLLIPNSSLLFEPGGLHVMLINLHRDLVSGDEFGFSLLFKSGMKLDLIAQVE